MESNLFSMQGLDPEEGRSSVLQLTAELGLRQRQLQELRSEEELWARRLQLALQAGRQDLLAAARQEAERLASRRQALEEEVERLRKSVEKLKNDLQQLGAVAVLQHSDQLVAELSSLIGEESTSNPQTWKGLEAEVELEHLKRTLGEAGGTKGG